MVCGWWSVVGWLVGGVCVCGGCYLVKRIKMTTPFVAETGSWCMYSRWRKDANAGAPGVPTITAPTAPTAPTAIAAPQNHY